MPTLKPTPKSEFTKRTDLDHKILFDPAFDLRSPEPSKNYGIGAMRVRFYILGPAGAVQFEFSTGWVPESAANAPNPGVEWSKDRKHWDPMSFDITHHAKEPLFDDNESPIKCDLLPEKKCYCNFSHLCGENWLKEFIVQGEDFVWKALEEEYVTIFEKGGSQRLLHLEETQA